MPVSGTLEAIANVADGLDVTGTTRIDFDFPAQRRHASVHAAVVDHDLVAPHAIEDLIAGQRAAGTLRKELQEAELFRRKADLLAVPEKLVGCEIQFAVPECT